MNATAQPAEPIVKTKRAYIRRAPSSPRRVAASRANGCRSKGPTTDEGKAIAAKANLQHGFCSSVEPAPIGLSAAYLEFRKDLHENTRPELANHFFFEDYASATWRLQLIRNAEQAAMDECTERLAASGDPNPMLHAFMELGADGTIGIFMRQELHLARIASQSLRLMMSSNPALSNFNLPPSDRARFSSGGPK